MQIATTSMTTALTSNPYPPVFDGTKTLRPRAKALSLPPKAEAASESKLHPSNDLMFSPAPNKPRTLGDLLGGACNEEVSDSMHVSTFEKLMRSTNYDLIAITPESVQKKPNPCKMFLAKNVETNSQISRADFSKSRDAEEALCAADEVVVGWNNLVNKMQSVLFGADVSRKLWPRFQY